MTPDLPFFSGKSNKFKGRAPNTTDCEARQSTADGTESKVISITEKFNNSEAVIIFFSICLLTLGFCSLFEDPHAKCYFATTEGFQIT